MRLTSSVDAEKGACITPPTVKTTVAGKQQFLKNNCFQRPNLFHSSITHKAVKVTKILPIKVHCCALNE